MYSYIVGELTQKENNLITVEANGIGYEIFASTNTMETIGAIGSKVKVYTYLHVREDEMLLYGFSTMQEKKMFLNLTTISGIGPKMAIGILSNISMSDLALAIVSNDASLLYKVKGIGKKTADRIVLELNEKLQDVEEFKVDTKVNGSAKEMEDAISGLVALGVNRIDAVKRVRQVAEENDTAEIIITKCLKGMNN
ncbi:MAG: Holliday junction branch migration protein RuvA [Clostridiales bacterium]|nr:Holliday junction branch migration protein RuvA [Candidatus Apopatousia equi]